MQVDILKKKNGNRCLLFDDSVDGNKALLKKYKDVCDELKMKSKQ